MPDTELIKVKLVLDQDLWRRYKQYCRKYGNDNPYQRLEDVLRSEVLTDSPANFTPSGRDKQFFTKEYYNENSRCFKYLLGSTALLVFANSFISKFLNTESLLGILIVIIFFISLNLALLSFGLHVFRSAFRGDDGDLYASAMGKDKFSWVVKTALYTEFFWWLSVVGSLTGFVLRGVEIFVILNSN